MKQANTTQFTDVRTLVPSNAEVYALFGAAVAVEGDCMVVGAPKRLETGNELGQVIVYTWNSVTSTYNEVATIVDPSNVRNTHFGTSVALDGNTLLVGAASTDDSTGRVYVFNKVGDTYVAAGVLQTSDAVANAHFGWSVAVDGDRMVVGAYTQVTNDLCCGKVYVYHRTGDTWTEVGALCASDARKYDYFGWSVAIHGDRMVVGACGADSEVEQGGKLYIYDWDSDASAYKEVLQLTPTVPESHSWYGSAVALSSDNETLVVGAIRGYADRTDGGKVYTYALVDDTYAETGVLYAPVPRGGAGFGSSIALECDQLVVGSKCANTFEHDTGKVYVYTE